MQKYEIIVIFQSYSSCQMSAYKQKKANPLQEFAFHFKCGRGDLNPYARKAPPPQDGASTKFRHSRNVNFLTLLRFVVCQT